MTDGQNPYSSTTKLQDGRTSPARRRLMAIASMYVGYAMFMVLRMTPAVVGTSITSDPNLGVSTADWAGFWRWERSEP